MKTSCSSASTAITRERRIGMTQGIVILCWMVRRLHQHTDDCIFCLCGCPGFEGGRFRAGSPTDVDAALAELRRIFALWSLLGFARSNAGQTLR